MSRRIGILDISRAVSSRGAGLVEFLLVLPVIIIFLFGIAELGREFSQIAWVSSVNYETTLVGAETNTKVGVDAMQSTFTNLREIHGIYNRRYVNSASPANVDAYKNDPTHQPSPYDTTINRTVSVEGQAQAKSIFNYLPLDFGVHYITGLLLANPDLTRDGLGNFSDDPLTKYNCDGTPVPSVSATPCGNLPVPTPPPPPPTPTRRPGQPCFTAGTPVTLADGSQKPIESVRVGDSVLAFDTAANQAVPSTVLKTFKHHVENLLVINATINTTPEHRFYLNGKWIAARELRVGDELLSVTGSKVKISSIAKLKKSVDVYNMHVADFHNYFAAGVLVHNIKAIPIE